MIPFDFYTSCVFWKYKDKLELCEIQTAGDRCMYFKCFTTFIIILIILKWCVCMDMAHTAQPVGVIGGCELPNMGTGKKT